MSNTVSPELGRSTALPVINYRDSKQREREALRAGILDVAGRLLVKEGPSALSMRRIAQEVNASTQVLYTMFGGKDGLADGLVERGSERMAAALAAVPQTGNSIQRLMNVCQCFLDVGLADSNYSQVMFMGVIPGYTPSEQARTTATRSFEAILEAVRDCGRAEVFEPAVIDDPRTAAVLLWSTVHGAVCLLLAGHLPDENAARELALGSLRATIEGLRVEDDAHTDKSAPLPVRARGSARAKAPGARRPRPARTPRSSSG